MQLICMRCNTTRRVLGSTHSRCECGGALSRVPEYSNDCSHDNSDEPVELVFGEDYGSNNQNKTNKELKNKLPLNREGQKGKRYSS